MVSGRRCVYAIIGKEMTRLFCDDIRPAPDGWHLARTVTEAVRVLSGGDVEEVSLDHDISHDIRLGSVHRPFPCEETFEPVARYIAATQCPDLKITIHTANPAGAMRLRGILEDYGFKNITTKMSTACARPDPLV